MSRNKKNTNKQSQLKQKHLQPQPDNEPDDHPTLVPTTGFQGPLSSIASAVLPGTAPIAERIRRVTQVQQSSFNGPIPHPEIFRKYGEVIPDAPERILKVFEEDSKHSREIQMKALVAQKNDNRRIHWMAWSLIAGGYAMSLVFALMNKDVLAGIVLTTTIVGTVTGFLQNRKDISAAESDDGDDE